MSNRTHKKWSRTRKVAAAVVSTLLICAVAALAFFLVTRTYEGSTSGTIKPATTTVHESLTLTTPPAIEKTGEADKVAIPVSFGAIKATTLEPGATAKVTTTPSTGACAPAWAVEGTSSQLYHIDARRDRRERQHRPERIGRHLECLAP